MKKIPVGLLGCGAIAPAYLRNLKNAFSGVADVAACADVLPANAAKQAAEFGIPRVCTPDELLADPGIELVVNLTPAPAHHASSVAIVKAGKHLFSEKPLALTREQGREILELARARGLRVGGAADTFLGAGGQLARRVIDEGRIGVPLAAQVLVTVGFFHWARYHEVYRGALLDLGPYYLTALVSLLGPMVRVSGAAEIRFSEKPHAAGTPEEGTMFPVDIPTTVSAALEFADGTVASLAVSCDTHANFRRVEILGTKGTLTLADANFYKGAVVLRTEGGEETIEPPAGFAETGRGLGVAEMAVAIREGRDPRASGELMYHVLDAMLAVHDSSAAGRHVRLTSTAARPAPFDFAAIPAPPTPPGGFPPLPI